MTLPDGKDDEATFLLRSMADLDEEYRAGDLDRADYEALREAYLQRAALALADDDDGTLHAEVGSPADSGVDAVNADGDEVGVVAEVVGRTAASSRSAGQRLGRSESALRTTDRTATSWARRIAIAAGVLALAAGAGLVVARSAGQRLANDEATGSIRTIGDGRRERIAAGLAAGQAALTNDSLAALRAYDSVLEEDPTNAEALTYSGWVLRLVAVSATGADRAELFFGAGRRLDAAVAANETYPDARALRAVHRLRDLNDRAGAAEDIAALDRGEVPPEIAALISGIRADLAETQPGSDAPASSSPAAPPSSDSAATAPEPSSPSSRAESGPTSPSTPASTPTTAAAP